MRRILAAATAGLLLTAAACAGGGDDVGVRAAATAAERPPAVLADLAERCATSVGDDGFGRVEIAGKLIASNETVDITVPCRIKFTGPGELQFNQVTLTSRHLVVGDTDAAGPTSVTVNNSTLRGDDEWGFLVDLYDADDAVDVHRSTVDYGQSVSLRAQGVRDGAIGGGSISVTSSTLRSMAADTEGVMILAGDVNGGSARLINVTIETPPGAENVLLAESCQAVELVGAPPECGPLTEEDLAQE